MGIKYYVLSIKGIVLFLWLVLFTTLAPLVQAHLAGQPPYFKINNQYVLLYSVPLTSLTSFNLPQDSAPENYLINKPIHFEFDIGRLPAPPDIIKKTKFSWKFGDGTTGEGLAVDHTYSKTGSYILDIFADDGTTPTPQIIEKTLVNILPNLDYQLPKAVIKVNDQISQDALTDVLSVDFSKSVQLDASSSKGKIVSFFWDLGDQKSSNEKVVDHQYQKDLTQVFPVLRVIDNRGLIGDSFVEIENQNLAGQNTLNNLNTQKKVLPNPTQKSTGEGQLKFSIATILGLSLIFFGLRKFFKKK